MESCRQIGNCSVYGLEFVLYEIEGEGKDELQHFAIALRIKPPQMYTSFDSSLKSKAT